MPIGICTNPECKRFKRLKEQGGQLLVDKIREWSAVQIGAIKYDDSEISREIEECIKYFTPDFYQAGILCSACDQPLASPGTQGLTEEAQILLDNADRLQSRGLI